MAPSPYDMQGIYISTAVTAHLPALSSVVTNSKSDNDVPIRVLPVNVSSTSGTVLHCHTADLSSVDGRSINATHSSMQ